MKNEEKFPLIDAFLMQRISDEEKQELKTLRTDEQFEDEFQFRKEAYEASKKQGRIELKERLASLDRGSSKLIPMKSWWLVAAAIGLLLVAIPLLMSPPSSDKLYADFYTKMPNKVAPITRGSDEVDPIKMGFIHYQRSEYAKAAEIFEEEIENKPELATYLGIMAMEEKRFSEAIVILEPISQDDSRRFKEDAEWYLALSHLASDNKDKSIAILERISKRSGRYADRAMDLLRELE